MFAGTSGAKAGRLLEPGRLRLQPAEITPLLHVRVRLSVSKKEKKAGFTKVLFEQSMIVYVSVCVRVSLFLATFLYKGVSLPTPLPFIFHILQYLSCDLH